MQAQKYSSFILFKFTYLPRYAIAAILSALSLQLRRSLLTNPPRLDQPVDVPRAADTSVLLPQPPPVHPLRLASAR